MLEPLPIDQHVERICEVVRSRSAAVVVAPAGAGKTTRIPPALAADGPVILLQPRRVAARSLARRIAVERGWTIGDEVGWQVRFERRFGARTRLLVATEGVLTARLQADPLLTGFRTVILDEFHERSLHGDLALALARQAAEARGDLRLVVMSATLDARPVAEFLGGCPVVEVPGSLHPVEIRHAPGLSPEAAVLDCFQRGPGHVLYFLPGAPEIRQMERSLRAAVSRLGDVRVLPLHGSLDSDAQDAALAPDPHRKLVLATNIAETSLTLEGVTAVIDSGLHKVLRRDPALGIDRLAVERISRDSAEQRAGRAGRTGPGRVLRLWDERDHLRPHREPEIRRVDLAGPLLDVLAWGGDPLHFPWFEPPPAEALRTALELLERLGAVESGRITRLGRVLGRLPLHPRLARVLVGSGGSALAAAACAALSEGWRPGDPPDATVSDLLVAADKLGSAPAVVRESAAQLARSVRALGEVATWVEPGGAEESLRRAVLASYPDRVAERREPGSRKLVLASGHGALLGRESGVLAGRFLVALDVVAGARGPGSEALVRLASGIEASWLAPTRVVIEHELDGRTGTVRAVERSCYEGLVLSERAVSPDPEKASEMLADALLARGLDAESEALLRRLRFAGLAVDLAELVRRACHGRTRLPDPDLRAHLPFEVLREAERLAPETIRVPSGRRVRLDYAADGSVVAAVKLQELFGLAETPRIGPRQEPLVFSLLAPNGRPVQTTRDLRSFWNTTYPEVRRQLRGRYPRHPWPEDPWAATATARTKRRGS